ncbi:Adaptor protein complex sigma subunit [Neolentinus lepideus HHB14362 ss-1]|uniref:Adaptor protein complex sigma subunit n=1 Tax=Neolentinus lepideus HHB14362 ss-1 TaxID=1314782 RepID=A0A165RFW7_9AGAM|nr:Adaptor protein complex sigma subunit [Neolentinus lepideus HHB14362 ss-1]
MIHAVLIFNTSGVPRLTKFYSPIHQSSQALVQKIFSLIFTRPAGLCNFLDAPELEEFLGSGGREDERLRVVYRSYATLHFVFLVDASESELGILDLIQVFVESLDRAFENVCELDLVFHFDEVHHILAEVIQGGLVLETNLDEIDRSGPYYRFCFTTIYYTLNLVFFSRKHFSLTVKQAAQARKTSFASSNPLSLGGGSSMGQRSAGLQTPLGWLTGKLAGVGAL